LRSKNIIRGLVKCADKQWGGGRSLAITTRILPGSPGTPGLRGRGVLPKKTELLNSIFA